MQGSSILVCTTPGACEHPRTYRASTPQIPLNVESRRHSTSNTTGSLQSSPKGCPLSILLLKGEVSRGGKNEQRKTSAMTANNPVTWGSIVARARFPGRLSNSFPFPLRHSEDSMICYEDLETRYAGSLRPDDESVRLDPDPATSRSTHEAEDRMIRATPEGRMIRATPEDHIRVYRERVYGLDGESDSEPEEETPARSPLTEVETTLLQVLIDDLNAAATPEVGLEVQTELKACRDKLSRLLERGPETTTVSSDDGWLRPFSSRTLSDEIGRLHSVLRHTSETFRWTGPTTELESEQESEPEQEEENFGRPTDVFDILNQEITESRDRDSNSELLPLPPGFRYEYRLRHYHSGLRPANAITEQDLRHMQEGGSLHVRSSDVIIEDRAEIRQLNIVPAYELTLREYENHETLVLGPSSYSDMGSRSEGRLTDEDLAQLRTSGSLMVPLILVVDARDPSDLRTMYPLMYLNFDDPVVQSPRTLPRGDFQEEPENPFFEITPEAYRTGVTSTALTHSQRYGLYRGIPAFVPLNTMEP